jgi:hypothetical protein
MAGSITCIPSTSETAHARALAGPTKSPPVSFVGNSPDDLVQVTEIGQHLLPRQADPQQWHPHGLSQILRQLRLPHGRVPT